MKSGSVASNAEMTGLGLVMMQKDEGRLLEAWLRFHERLTDPAKIVVMDNGSSDSETLQILESAAQRGIDVDYRYATNSDYQIKNEIFVARIGQMLSDGCDFVIPLDCDEFLFCLDCEEKADFTPEGLQAELRKYLDHEGHFMMKGSFYNSVGSAQKFGFGKERSVFFGKTPPLAMDHGYHSARTQPNDVLQIEVCQLHFQAKRAEISKRQATEKLRKRIPDFSRATLEAYTGAGAHMKKWFLDPPEGQSSPGRSFPAFSEIMANLGNCFPFDLFFDADRYEQSRKDLEGDSGLAATIAGGTEEREALCIYAMSRNVRRVVMFAPLPLALSVAGKAGAEVDVLSLSESGTEKRLPEEQVEATPGLRVIPCRLGVSVDGLGNPSEPARRSAVRRYAHDYFKSADPMPEVAVINGRYRVACVASAALLAPKILLIVPNFWSRPHYHVMLKFCGCVDTEGDTIVLRPDPDVPQEVLKDILDRHLTDPR